MTETTDRPLVTFAVIAYNQERFIREAIEGAFAQTYEPLEILLSDDCSPDRTYEIMQDMAAAYDGPHKVVLNRNEPNLGLISHVNVLSSLFQGKMLVLSAGDDVSMPCRTETIVETWISANKNPYLLHSNAIEMNETGESDGIIFCPPDEAQDSELNLVRIIEKQANCIGATAAWDRRLITEFGAIPEKALIEDRIMFLRAALLNRVKYISAPLVLYRSGGMSKPTNQSTRYQILFGSRIRSLSWKVGSMQVFIDDLLHYAPKNKNKLREAALSIIRDSEPDVIYSQQSFIKLLRSIPSAVALSIRLRSMQHIRSCVKYLAANVISS